MPTDAVGRGSRWPGLLPGRPATAITYPTPSTFNITATTASGAANLVRAGTTGNAFVQSATTPTGGSSCPATSNVFPINTSFNGQLTIGWTSPTVSDRDGTEQKDDVLIRFHTTEPFPFAEASCHLDTSPVTSSCRSGTVIYTDLAPGSHQVQITGYINDVSGHWEDFPRPWRRSR